MNAITSYDKLEDLGRVRLSASFFMRDFLYSEIAAWHGQRNVPDYPDSTIAVGRQLCELLLEPLQTTFGRVHVRSGYRSPSVNEYGNKNRLNCASNEKNYGAHIWDHPNANGMRGATACIVLPWLIDHIERGGRWTDMAWWIHDHLPYSTLYFFPRLAAFNINWHEQPVRRIDSYAEPKGCLTHPGMANHGGSHAHEYAGFPSPAMVATLPAVAAVLPAADASAATASVPPASEAPGPSRGTATGSILYRAVHTKNPWRKVGSHRTLEAALNGRDGAVGLFARKARIDYAKHGDPFYVVVWQAGSSTGYVVKADSAASLGVRQVEVSTADLQAFEDQGGASLAILARYF